MYTNVIPKRQSIWIRIFNFLFRYQDPERETIRNNYNRILGRYQK
jgi:hypothetical protein